MLSLLNLDRKGQQSDSTPRSTPLLNKAQDKGDEYRFQITNFQKMIYEYQNL